MAQLEISLQDGPRRTRIRDRRRAVVRREGRGRARAGVVVTGDQADARIASAASGGAEDRARAGASARARHLDDEHGHRRTRATRRPTTFSPRRSITPRRSSTSTRRRSIWPVCDSVRARGTTRRARTRARGPARSRRWTRRTRWRSCTRRSSTGPTSFWSSTPIRWGNASSLYYRMVERMNCVQNQVTIANRVLLRNKVASFIITGGQDNVQAVAGQMLGFFAESAATFRSSRTSRTHADGRPRTWRTTRAR